jgi:hypothetical protein
MTFYDRVKEQVRKNTSMTLESFIQSLDINYGTYQTQRKAHNLPRADEALKIASALNTTVEYLISGAEPENSKAAVLDDMQAFIDTYRLEMKREAAIKALKKQIERIEKLKNYQNLKADQQEIEFPKLMEEFFPEIDFSKLMKEFYSSKEDTTE